MESKPGQLQFKKETEVFSVDFNGKGIVINSQPFAMDLIGKKLIDLVGSYQGKGYTVRDLNGK
jgi:hypothetical protein